MTAEPAAVTERLHRPPYVYMYHSVSPSTEDDPHQLRVHPDRLDEQLSWLSSRGLRGVSMRELLAAVDRGERRKLVGLTFDDGYRDFLEHAVPVLKRHGMTATVYVVAGKLAGRNDWDEGPTLPLMTAEEVRTAAAEGFEVGSHSLNHVRLAGLPAADLRREIADSRAALEDLLGQHVTSFCYPYGNWDAAAASSVADAGYDNACEVDDYTRPARFSIPRFYVGQADLGLRLWAKHLRHRLRLLSRARRS